MTHTSFRLSILAACAAAFLQGATFAQTYHFSPSDTPTTGTCNVFPWGQSSTRHQHVVTAAELGNAPRTIRDIGYASCGSGTFTSSQITIRMSHVAPGPLNPTFAANYATPPVTMLSSTSFSWTYTQHAWADVGLTGTFNYDPTLGDLLIEIEFCNGAGGSSFHRDISPRCWFNGAGCTPPASGTSATGALKVRVCSSTGGTFNTFGTGCGTPPLTIAGTGVPNIGTQVTISMSNGLANSPGLYLIGTAPVSIDLTPFQAPGCTLYTLWIADVPTTFDGSGNSSLPLGIPMNPFLVGLSLVLTGVDVNPGANPLGLTTANGLTMTIGV